MEPKDPKDLRYTESHEWISADGTVGVTAHAQKEITDVVFVELPKPGRAVKAKEALAVVESVKAAFDIYAPVSGEVEAVNDAAAKNPALVNQSPYGEGWLFRLKSAAPADREGLMTLAQYDSYVASGAH